MPVRLGVRPRFQFLDGRFQWPTLESFRNRKLPAPVGALAAVSASALQDAPTVRFDARSADRMVVAAADVNGDGSVSVEEREAFFAAHVPGADAVLDRDTFLALALTPYYDADGDRAFGAADVAALLARWDSDGVQLTAHDLEVGRQKGEGG